MLCQHLDKLHADDQVERVAQKHCKALVGFRIARKAEHLAHHLYTRDNNGDEHDDGNGDFNNACKNATLRRKYSLTRTANPPFLLLRPGRAQPAKGLWTHALR